jgi:hypothetical protein
MRRLSKFALVSVFALTVPAYAQFAAITVYTDSLGNTTGGVAGLYTEYQDEGSDPQTCPSQGCGSYNSAFGYYALTANSSGNDNTAVGFFALSSNQAGGDNTATGYFALLTTTGSQNAAFGSNALASLGNSSGNTAVGDSALKFLATGGGYNTAVGHGALLGSGYAGQNGPVGNSTGVSNTAVGTEALQAFTTASYNSALGMQALTSTTTGNYNTASGYGSMYANTSGVQNSAYGLYALHGNGKGNYNTGLGGYALYGNTSGSSNIALGYKAGFYPTAGANNIHIGNLGAAGDTGVIKIGTAQTAASIAGIYSTSPMTGGSVVVVNSEGLLGVQAVSSERFKRDISPIGHNSTKLEQLRPVSFHYKGDPHGPLQYGLVAEEVAKVYPELVTRDGHGDVNGVRYDELAPMLLNVVQEQEQRAAEQAKQIRELQAAVLALQASRQSH